MNIRDSKIRHRIVEAIAERPLSRTDLHRLFDGSNWSVYVADIDRVLDSMQIDGLIDVQKVPSNGGRPKTLVVSRKPT